MLIHDIYNAYSFVSPSCCVINEDESICTACVELAAQSRRKCSTRAKSVKKEYVPGRSLEFTTSSPTLVEQFASYETKAKNKLQSIGYYCKSKYKYIVEKRGIDIATE